MGNEATEASSRESNLTTPSEYVIQNLMLRETILEVGIYLEVNVKELPILELLSFLLAARNQMTSKPPTNKTNGPLITAPLLPPPKKKEARKEGIISLELFMFSFCLSVRFFFWSWEKLNKCFVFLHILNKNACKSNFLKRILYFLLLFFNKKSISGVR